MAGNDGREPELTRRRGFTRFASMMMLGGLAIFVVSACGADDAGSDETSTTAETSTTPTEGDGPDTTDEMSDDDRHDAVVAVVDEYIDAVAAGDLTVAWGLLDGRSQEAIGGLSEFEVLGTALAEGIGSWSGAEGRTTFVNEVGDVDGVTAWAATLLGAVAQEGPSALSSASMIVYLDGEAVTVSPFEKVYGDAGYVTFDPEAGAPLAPSGPVAVTIPNGSELRLAAFDDVAVTIPDDVSSSLEISPDEPLAGGDHVVTVVVGHNGGLAAVAAHYTVNGADGDSPTTTEADDPADETTSTVLPASPTAWAEAAFAAWISGDDASLQWLATAEVQQALQARPPADDDDWAAAPACDGAAGSTYCQWAGANEDLVLRVANEAVDLGDPAVIEARFE